MAYCLMQLVIFSDLDGTLLDAVDYSWKDGERWNGTLYDKEGKIIGKFMNGWFDQ